MISYTHRMISYGCGHKVFTEMIVGKVDQSIQHRSKTRCLECFNSRSLPPSPELSNANVIRD